jgi:hypothetical protein
MWRRSLDRRLEVLDPIVRCDPIDVIEDQRHRLASPFLSLTTKLTSTDLQTFAKEAPLESPAAVARVLDKNLIEWLRVA